MPYISHILTVGIDMEGIMNIIYKMAVIASLACFLDFSIVDAMLNVCIRNEMSRDLYIDSFRTSGCVVENSTALVDELLATSKQVNLCIQITSPTCSSTDNFVTLSIPEREDPILLRWGKDAVKTDDYVISGFCRITQHSDDRGIIIFTFRDDSESVVSKLVEWAISRLHTLKGSQQTQDSSLIKKYSGLKPSEILD